jgi:hypothetical protein
MSYWTIYWITRLDTISEALGIFAVLTSLLFAVCTVLAIVIGGTEENDIAYFFRKAKRLWIFGAVVAAMLGLMCVLTPTTKEAAVIYLVPKMVNSEAAKEVENLPKDFARLLQKKVEGWLDEQVAPDQT